MPPPFALADCAGQYQATMWKRDLDGILLPVAESYRAAIRSDCLREAVWYIQVEGDTFMTQFRGL